MNMTPLPRCFLAVILWVFPCWGTHVSVAWWLVHWCTHCWLGKLQQEGWAATSGRVGGSPALAAALLSVTPCVRQCQHPEVSACSVNASRFQSHSSTGGIFFFPPVLSRRQLVSEAQSLWFGQGKTREKGRSRKKNPFPSAFFCGLYGIICVALIVTCRYTCRYTSSVLFDWFVLLISITWCGTEQWFGSVPCEELPLLCVNFASFPWEVWKIALSGPSLGWAVTVSRTSDAVDLVLHEITKRNLISCFN